MDKTYRLWVKYNGDQHYTLIKSNDAVGSIEKIGTYLTENYRYIDMLGGAERIDIKAETPGDRVRF